MNINPEFQRNIWLEISAYHIALMTIILGLVFSLVTLVNGEIDESLAYISLALFVILVPIWGGKLAHQSIIQEVDNHTWDGQRMSSIAPWSMTWGKLFGSTLLTWFGGAICLVVYVMAALTASASLLLITKITLVFVFIGLFCQATSMMSALMQIHQRVQIETKATGRSFVVIVFIVIFGLLSMFFLESQDSSLDVKWYARSYSLLDFTLSSAITWTLWVFLGNVALMRRELQNPANPIVWIFFLIFLTMYLFGFLYGSTTSIRANNMIHYIFFSIIIVTIVTYFMLLVERKDLVLYRRIQLLLQAGRWNEATRMLPCWFINLNILLLLVVVCLATTTSDTLKLEIDKVDRWLPVAIFLFLLRDTCIILTLNISTHLTRWGAPGMILILLFVLYIILPGIVGNLGGQGLMNFFYPVFNVGLLMLIVPPLLQFVAMCSMMFWRLGQAQQILAINNADISANNLLTD